MLPGLSTARRDGIALMTGFTANVSVDLAIGAIGETILVSAESPIVDTRTVRQDGRVSKIVPVGRLRIQGNLDAGPMARPGCGPKARAV